MSKLVVVMGCIEGMIPRVDYNAPHAEKRRRLEEQRRLFYVALTRTTETLILSSVNAYLGAARVSDGVGRWGEG